MDCDRLNDGRFIESEGTSEGEYVNEFNKFWGCNPFEFALLYGCGFMGVLYGSGGLVDTDTEDGRDKKFFRMDLGVSDDGVLRRVGTEFIELIELTEFVEFIEMSEAGV